MQILEDVAEYREMRVIGRESWVVGGDHKKRHGENESSYPPITTSCGLVSDKTKYSSKNNSSLSPPTLNFTR